MVAMPRKKGKFERPNVTNRTKRRLYYPDPNSRGGDALRIYALWNRDRRAKEIAKKARAKRIAHWKSEKWYGRSYYENGKWYQGKN